MADYAGTKVEDLGANHSGLAAAAEVGLVTRVSLGYGRSGVQLLLQRSQPLLLLRRQLLSGLHLRGGARDLRLRLGGRQSVDEREEAEKSGQPVLGESAGLGGGSVKTAEWLNALSTLLVSRDGGC